MKSFGSKMVKLKNSKTQLDQSWQYNTPNEHYSKTQTILFEMKHNWELLFMNSLLSWIYNHRLLLCVNCSIINKVSSEGHRKICIELSRRFNKIIIKKKNLNAQLTRKKKHKSPLRLLYHYAWLLNSQSYQVIIISPVPFHR